MDKVKELLRVRNALVRECFAEFLGIYILIIFGCGAVAQVTTSSLTRGEYLSINLAFAFGVTFGVHVSRGVSGAHLNPAVSLAMCLLGRLPWRKLPVYALFQLLGAFVGAATVYAQYRDAIMQYSEGNLTATGPLETASIFATYPAPYLSIFNGFVDQVIGTASLLVCVLALGDSQNSPAPKGLEPVLVGMSVLVIGLAMGSNCGYAINPARDLGPRLFTCVGGWGVEVFSAGRHWWWVPLLGPMVGSLLGTAVYCLLIELHHPAQEGVPEDCQTVKNKYAIELEEGTSKPGGGGAKDGEQGGGGGEREREREREECTMKRLQSLRNSLKEEADAKSFQERLQWG